MTNGLKPYPSYKDSGVLWLGQIPSHWEPRKLGQIGSLSKGNGGSKEDEVASGIPCVRYGDLYTTHRGFIEKSRSLISPDRAEFYTPISFGDVLFAASGETIDEIGKSAENLLGSQAFCGGDIIVLHPKIALATRYMGYAADCHPCAAQKASMGRGITVKHIYADQIKSLSIPLPPVPEQSAIVRFLDYIGLRIQRYIRAKKKLIALLNEQKQAIINRLVTRGLDPGVRLKPSGVDGLGDIPEHWDVMLNQRIFKEVIRPHGGRPETQLSLSQKDGLIATTTMQERSLQTSSYDNWKVTLPGDLVLNRFKAHLGVFFAATLRGIVSFHYGVFAPRRNLMPEYFELLYHLNAYKTIYAGRSNGMTVGLQNLSNQNFYCVRSIFPPLEEQAEIVAAVEAATKGLNHAARTVQGEIELLHEFRTRLIADVVTGKLDVREAAVRLPEEAETELLDESEEVGEGGEDLDALPEDAVA